MGKQTGFSLLEMLLVLIIMGTMAYAGMSFYQQKTLQARIDRTVAQMQQILNAGLSYYLANGRWPTDLACLQGSGETDCAMQFLPKEITNPWGGLEYKAIASKDRAMFYVYTTISSATGSSSAQNIAEMVAGGLPLAYTSEELGNDNQIPQASKTCTGNLKSCAVVASVNIPGESINTARGVNFSGLYHNGGCVPVPQCPVDYVSGYQMKPQIYVVPVSVTGFAENSNAAFPINSFSAYAKGGNNISPPACDNKSANGQGENCGIDGTSSNAYWRACLQVSTENGPLSESAQPDWGKNVTVLVFTKCAVNNEEAGSSFKVFE